MIQFNFENECYGCQNCENICPQNAIQLKENKEGFKIPVIDNSKCIQCGLCIKKCPKLNEFNGNDIVSNTWLSAFNKNVEERGTSTSGGIFPLIAKLFIDSGNYVCGCVWDKNMKPIHILTNKFSDVLRMKGSKYLQSDLNDVCKQIKEKIVSHKILFVGTPCQIAAVKLYIGNNPNLYLCSLICEGVGSFKVWNKYVKLLEKKYNSKMIYASFRNKEISWEVPVIKCEFENGKVYKNLAFANDKFVMGFSQGLFYRNTCNNCKFKGNNIYADLVIGDLWGADNKIKEKSDNKGVSLIVIRNNRGEELFNHIKEYICYEEIENKEYFIKNNEFFMKSISKNKNREYFFENIDTININKNLENNLEYSKFKQMIKVILYKCKIYNIVKSILKK